MVKSKSELCDTATKKVKNTGQRGLPCLEGTLIKMAVAKQDFRFDTFADFKTLAKWNEAIATKDVIPLFDAYEVADENTEATKYETGNFSYETSPAVKKTGSESYLSFCSHAALASLRGSEYSQMFEFNSDGSVVGIYDSDGVKIKGQDLKDLNIGIRNRATKDKVPFTKVTATYRDFKELEENYAVAKPTWTAADIEGVYDVVIEQVSATSTNIKVRISEECSSAKVKSLVTGDLVVKNLAGAVQTITWVGYDEDLDLYELTGTSLADGFTVSLDGVVTAGEVSYEAIEPLVLAVT